jgi:uncharacterized membrane protein YeaQ/YmgE (transglycosylase-associated protein family)
MSFLGWVISLSLVGLLVGGLARLALPGKDPLTIGQTILVGLAGSALALGVGAIINRGVALPVAVIFATVIMYFIRRSRGGSLSDPGRPPEQ